MVFHSAASTILNSTTKSQLRPLLLLNFSRYFIGLSVTSFLLGTLCLGLSYVPDSPYYEEEPLSIVGPIMLCISVVALMTSVILLVLSRNMARNSSQRTLMQEE